MYVCMSVCLSVCMHAYLCLDIYDYDDDDDDDDDDSKCLKKPNEGKAVILTPQNIMAQPP